MLVWPQRPLLFFFPQWLLPSVKGDCWLSISLDLHKAKVQQYCREWARSIAHQHLPESAVWAEPSVLPSLAPCDSTFTPPPRQTTEVGEVKSQSEFQQIGLEQFGKTASCDTLFPELSLPSSAPGRLRTLGLLSCCVTYSSVKQNADVVKPKQINRQLINWSKWN